MSCLVLVVALLAAVDPARLWLALPRADRGSMVVAPEGSTLVREGQRQRRLAAVVAALVGLGVVVAAAASADSLIDALDVSPDTFRIAAGAIAGLGAARRLLQGAPPGEPSLGGWRAGLVPLAFPILLGPDLVALAMLAGLDRGTGCTALAAAGVLLAVPVAGLVRAGSGPSDRVALGISRLLAGALGVVAVDLLVDGVKAV